MGSFKAPSADWQLEIGDTEDISVPNLKAWKILVQEFDGAADQIESSCFPSTYKLRGWLDSLSTPDFVTKKSSSIRTPARSSSL